MILVDTNILIDFANKDSRTMQVLESLEKSNELSISVITEMELLIGCRNKSELNNLRKFLSRYRIIEITEKISFLSKQLLEKYHLSHGLSLPDAFIAGTSIAENSVLLTRNLKDFKYIESLSIFDEKNWS